MAHGRLRLALRFITTKTRAPMNAAIPAHSRAAQRSDPPSRKIANEIAYQSHPSPPRVAQIIHSRIQRGARQLFRRRMTR